MKPDVLFLQPCFPIEMQHFTRGLHRAGARVWGVGDSSKGSLPASLTQHLAGYLQVPSLMQEDQAIVHIERWLQGRRPDLVESAWEPTMLLAARLRERWGLPGMSMDAVLGFRDKKLMHERIAGAGLRTAQSARLERNEDAWPVVERIGYPVVIKPTAGAGGANTFICGDAVELQAALRSTQHVRERIIEAFVSGDEYTHETLCVNGTPVFQSVCRYEPVVLDARKNEWISPIIFCYRDVNDPTLTDGVRLGLRAVDALHMGSGLTHMEWFRQADGSAVFGEMACRPPGSKMMDLMNYARNQDLYAAWGSAVLGIDPQLPAAAPYNAAIIFKRAMGEGRIRSIHGLGSFLREHGEHVAQVDMLPIGAPRRDWTRTFIADGNIVVRHPDFKTTLELARKAASTIHLTAA